MVLLLYPNVRISGLSLLLPSWRCFPKYSSNGSWQKRSVNTNSIPSSSKNLVTSMAEETVSLKPSWVCQERNMRARAFWLKFPGLFSALSFHSLRYSKKSTRNWNLCQSKFTCLNIVIKTQRYMYVGINSKPGRRG